VPEFLGAAIVATETAGLAGQTRAATPTCARYASTFDRGRGHAVHAACHARWWSPVSPLLIGRRSLGGVGWLIPVRLHACSSSSSPSTTVTVRPARVTLQYTTGEANWICALTYVDGSWTANYLLTKQILITVVIYLYISAY
jgi:hypothetical protein